MRSIFVPVIIVITCLFSCRKTDSAKEGLPTAHTFYNSIPYGPETAQNADIYLPANVGVRPSAVIIMIHGGGWTGGYKPELYQSDFYELMTQNGYAIAEIDYRRSPAYTYPAQLDDIDSVIRFIERNASKWHLDPYRICMYGQSSGAQLALQYAYTRNKEGRVKVVMDFFGPVDLPDSTVLTDHLVTDATGFLGYSYQANPQIWHDASPIYYTSHAVPTIIFQGSADTTVYPVQSERLKDSLQLKNVPFQYNIWAGDGHYYVESDWENNENNTLLFLETYL